MPFYYTAIANNTITSNATPGSETDHMRFLTISNQTPALITFVTATGRNTTLGGGGIRVRRYTTPSTNGVALTPAPKNPRNPAANTTCLSSNSTWLLIVGSTVTDIFEMPISQVGGGGWVPNEQDDAIVLLPNGGANGNMDLLSVSATASMTIDLTVGFGEI